MKILRFSVSPRRRWSTTASSVLLLCLLIVSFISCANAVARRTSSRRIKTNGRSYSNRHNTAQSQTHSHAQVAKNAPKAPPGSNAHNANKAVAPSASAPQAPSPGAAASNPSNIGWNVNNGQKPVGPPPPYPGMGNNYAHPAGAPPAYSPYAQRPPGYFQGGAQGSNVGYPQQQSFNPYMQHGVGGGGMAPGMMGYGAGAGGMPQMGYGGGGYGGNPYGGMMGGGMGMMGGGMGMMGGGMGMMGYQQKKSSMFSLSNVLTGVALYSVFRSLGSGFGGGGMYGQGYNNYGPREVHIYDHREHKPTDPNDLKPIMGTLGLPQSVTGEKIELPAKTIEQIAEATKEQNLTTTVTNVNGTVVEDPLPPLPFDNQPKIYYGYGYAFGYQNSTVEYLSAKDGTRIVTSEEASTASNGPIFASSTETSSESDGGTSTPEENITMTNSDTATTMKSQVE